MARRVRRVRRVKRGRVSGATDVDKAQEGLGIGAAGVGEEDDSAATVDGVRRKPAASDSFADGEGAGREAYEAYLKGNVAEDAQRFAALRDQGAVDSFDPGMDPSSVEKLGQIKAAAHMIRLYDHWTLEGVDRTGAIEKASSWLAGFSRTDNVRKVLTELESKPIRDVYPLEVMLHILETAPQKLPGVQKGHLIGSAPAFTEDRVFAGHPVQVPVPDGVRLKGFALLGGLRPGYEFHPSASKDDQYTLLIDTPGTWEFAVLGVRTQALGKMTKELPGGVVERFEVHVREMGRKEPQAETV